MRTLLVLIAGWICSTLFTMWTSHIIFGHFGHPGFNFETSMLLAFIMILSVFVGTLISAFAD